MTGIRSKMIMVRECTNCENDQSVWIVQNEAKIKWQRNKQKKTNRKINFLKMLTMNKISENYLQKS